MPDTIAMALADAEATLAAATAALDAANDEAARLPLVVGDLRARRTEAAAILADLDRRTDAIDAVTSTWGAKLAAARAAVAAAGGIGTEKVNAVVTAAEGKLGGNETSRKNAWQNYAKTEKTALTAAQAATRTAEAALATKRTAAAEAAAALAIAETELLGLVQAATATLDGATTAVAGASRALLGERWGEAYVLAQDAGAARTALTTGDLSIVSPTLVADAKAKFAAARANYEAKVHAALDQAVIVYDKRATEVKAAVKLDAKLATRVAGAAAAVDAL